MSKIVLEFLEITKKKKKNIAFNNKIKYNFLELNT